MKLSEDEGKELIIKTLDNVKEEYKNNMISLQDILIKLYGVKAYINRFCDTEVLDTASYISLCILEEIIENKLKYKE